MEKSKRYKQVKFSARVLRKAIAAVTAGKEVQKVFKRGSVTSDNETWSLEDLEEFLSAYAKSNVDVVTLRAAGLELRLYASGTDVSVEGETREFINGVFSIFEEAPSEDKTILEKAFKDEIVVFIGHGRNGQWEKLKTHLVDQHRIRVESYESGARAGHTIRDILDRMADSATFAILVLTGEDKTEAGVRARQNVIHECGLFQGRLGFDRAIMLVEEGVELASNFQGIQQLRFRRGHIAGLFGDIIATLRREFGPI